MEEESPDEELVRLRARVAQLESVFALSDLQRDFIVAMRVSQAMQLANDTETVPDNGRTPADWLWHVSQSASEAMFHYAHMGHWKEPRIDAYHGGKYLGSIVECAATCANWHAFAARHHMGAKR